MSDFVIGLLGIADLIAEQEALEAESRPVVERSRHTAPPAESTAHRPVEHQNRPGPGYTYRSGAIRRFEGPEHRSS
jgi:hypothetical protein